MKAQRTSWKLIIFSLISGLIPGIALAYFTRDSRINVLGASWIIDVILAAVGVVALIFGWIVHQYAIGKLKDIEPKRAFNTIVLAQSSTVGGAVLCGWYIGQLVMVVSRYDVPFYGAIVLECAIAAGICLFDIIAGLIAQWMCQIPPTKGPEHPDVKKQSASS